MKKKLFVSVVALIYVIYIYAISVSNNLLGDIFSPMIMLLITGYIFKGYVIRQKSKVLKWFGWSLTLAIFAWFICDFMWAIDTHLLKVDPENYFITVYGYSFTNLFLFFAILISCFLDLKQMNKIQALLDAFIVALFVSVLLWIFVFEKSLEKIIVIWTDPVSMISLILDIIIYAWINVWAFSARTTKPLFYHRLIVTGGLIFVITDLIYYYYWFYSEYEPNSWIDGGYVLAFSFIAISVLAKEKAWGKSKIEKSAIEEENIVPGKFGFELLILFVPVAVFIFRRTELLYIILLIVSLLIYYILINFTQKNMFQEKLLTLEKSNVLELEKKVEERTEEIFKLLNTDFLTGLNSRRYFELKLSEEIKNLKVDEQVALLYVDQNKSKAIKHLYGKDVAEELLRKLSGSIQQVADLYKGMLAAYEDDVFVIMLKGNDAEANAENMAEQIINKCNELFIVDNHAIRVTLNIGISCYPRDTFREADLIKNADIAMMQARTKGYDQIQLYNERIGNLSYSRHRIELKLKKVVFDEEFQLYFQPQVNCVDGTLCGFESLLRWFEGGKKFIPPLDFIPIAEEIGLIVPLGYWIMQTAARQYAVWKKATGNDYKISVNVSSKQLIEVDFVQRLQNILEEYNVPPEMFEIEITESHQIENSVNILVTLNDIKKLGVSIAIDDFGTGYSSLYYIKNIPTDRIKIAKELVDNIENDIYSKSIIQMAISVAKVMNIKAIAEGVETLEQLNCLKELGCDEIQGYYFSKPMPVREIEENWLK